MVNRTQNNELVALASADVKWTFIPPPSGPNKHYGWEWVKECKSYKMVRGTM